MSPEPFIGRTLDGRFRIVRLIGEGGMGQVYEAVQLSVDRRVALKVLDPAQTRTPMRRKRFFREAKALASLEHPNIIRIIEFGEDSETGTLFMVMDFLDGASLADLIERGPVDWRVAYRIAARVASALGAAHERGIVHRDLKPENIMMVVATDGRAEPVVLDFGIAHVPDQSEEITKEGDIFGTPTYMSPEQARGWETGPATDLYALGTILFELLTGRPPFVEPVGMALLLAKIRNPAPEVDPFLPPGVRLPAAARKLLRELLATETGDRPASSRVVLDDIRDLFGEQIALSATPGPDPFHGWLATSSDATPLAETLEREATTQPKLHAPRPSPMVEDSPPVVAARATSRLRVQRAAAWAATIVAVAVLAGLVAILVADDTDGDELASTRVVDRGMQSPPTIEDEPVVPQQQSGRIPAPAKAPAGDVGAVLDTAWSLPINGTAGCGSPAPPALQVASQGDVAWTAYRPSTYDPKTPHGVLLLFHDTESNHHEMATAYGFREIAEANDLVIVSPQSPGQIVGAKTLRAWRISDGHDTVQPPRVALAGASNALCLDTTRIYGISVGAGVYGLAPFACERQLAGMVVIGAQVNQRVICRPEKRPTPRMVIVADDDVRFPAETGHSGCRPDVSTPTRTETDAIFRAENLCREEDPREYSTNPDASCVTWACEQPYVSCRPPGGAEWKSNDSPKSENAVLWDNVGDLFAQAKGCVQQRTDFPFPQVAWDFLERESIPIPLPAREQTE